jgi:hypothetical protein
LVVCFADGVVKEALVKLTLGQSMLQVWVFIKNITDEFAMGLDTLWTHGTM